MIRLVRRVSEKNMLRFYLIQVVPGLFGQWGLLREWGRVGCPGKTRMDWYVTKEMAHKASEKLLESKLNRGYCYARGSADCV